MTSGAPGRGNACSTGHFLDHHLQQVSKALPWHRRQTSAQHADPPVGGRPSDLRVPAHHATGEPAAKGRRQAQYQCQAGAADHAGQPTDPRATHGRRPGRTHDGIVIAPRSNVPRAPITSSLPAATARSSAYCSPSTPAIGRSSPGRLRPRASPARWFAT